MTLLKMVTLSQNNIVVNGFFLELKHLIHIKT